MLRIERCRTARIEVSLIGLRRTMEYQVFSTRHLEATTGMFTFFWAVVCAVYVLFAFHTDRCRLWVVLVSRSSEVASVLRALNFVHYVRCVKFFYARRLRTLRELFQKPSYVVAVVEFCVHLIHLSLWYCKSRQRSFVRFFGIVF